MSFQSDIDKYAPMADQCAFVFAKNDGAGAVASLKKHRRFQHKRGTCFFFLDTRIPWFYDVNMIREAKKMVSLKHGKDYRVPQKHLDHMTDIILETAGKDKVRKIYLFGSQAYGRPKKASDIDVCVVTANRIRLCDFRFKLVSALDKKGFSPLDMLCYTENIFNDRSGVPGIINTISRKGKILYG